MYARKETKNENELKKAEFEKSDVKRKKKVVENILKQSSKQME